MKYADVKFDK